MNTQDPSVIYEVHPAYARNPGPPRLPGESHQRGICGGNADLCGWCWEHQLAWHKKIGKEIGESDPPKPGEREGVYWHRVGGRFLDTYIEACREAFKAARK